MIFKEYELIKKGDISTKAFDDLKKFASYEENHNYIDVARGGNALRLKNYVGTITTQDGTTIEILPKIYGSEDDNLETKIVLLKMLQTLKKTPFKNINPATLGTANINIFEIFITMFLDGLTQLIKKGIKADYIRKQENSNFLKGKLKLNTHLKHNLLNKGKFYIEFDEYSSNRIENKLIKTTLLKLYQTSNSISNKQRLREFIFVFDDIDNSSDIKNDFKKCKTDRSMSHYRDILSWCRIFLNNESFFPYKGNNIAHALLFDMNVLFESYVAHFFKKQYSDRDVKTQDKKYKLIESPKLFQLRPDIVIDEDVVLDTKWKLIDSQKKNLNISQSDLYQMYTYGKKYKSNDVYLIYPKSKNFTSSIEKPYLYDESLNLHILCFDCNDMNNNYDLLKRYGVMKEIIKKVIQIGKEYSWLTINNVMTKKINYTENISYQVYNYFKRGPHNYNAEELSDILKGVIVGEIYIRNGYHFGLGSVSASIPVIFALESIDCDQAELMIKWAKYFGFNNTYFPRGSSVRKTREYHNYITEYSINDNAVIQAKEEIEKINEHESHVNNEERLRSEISKNRKLYEKQLIQNDEKGRKDGSQVNLRKKLQNLSSYDKLVIMADDTTHSAKYYPKNMAYAITKEDIHKLSKIRKDNLLKICSIQVKGSSPWGHFKKKLLETVS